MVQIQRGRSESLPRASCGSAAQTGTICWRSSRPAGRETTQHSRTWRGCRRPTAACSDAARTDAGISASRDRRLLHAAKLRHDEPTTFRRSVGSTGFQACSRAGVDAKRRDRRRPNALALSRGGKFQLTATLWSGRRGRCVGLDNSETLIGCLPAYRPVASKGMLPRSCVALHSLVTNLIYFECIDALIFGIVR
jgi:hypothetical protein